MSRKALSLLREKKRTPAPLKHHIYRSTSKIETLWEQTRGASIAKLSGELKISFGPVGATGKAEPKDLTVEKKAVCRAMVLELSRTNWRTWERQAVCSCDDADDLERG